MGKKNKNSKKIWRHVPTESVVEFQDSCREKRRNFSHVQRNTCNGETVQARDFHVTGSGKPLYEINEPEARLATLLSSNQKKAHKVPPDGNCFCNAVCYQLRRSYPQLDGQKLRQMVCDHLMEQKGVYSYFIQHSASETFEAKICRELKPIGRWNTYLGDLLPLAIANLFNTRVEIFSSGAIPKINVCPSLPQSSMKHDATIQLVYSARPGRQHYDSCIDKY